MAYTLLIVDDDQSFREELRESLDEYHVVEAANGEEALAILRQPHDIDLVILDIFMPGHKKGTDILKILKKEYPDLAIIIQTGYSSKDTAIEALKGSADEYLEKPFDIAKAKQIIETVLNRKNGHIDPDTCTQAEKIQKVIYFLERNVYKKVTLIQAAKVVYLSPKYFSRLFKEQTQKGFNDVKLQIKMSTAQKLLQTTGSSVEQIAYKLGYLNAESFIRIFKKNIGQTPASYRNYLKK